MAGGRERGATPPQKATYLVADSPDAEDEDAGLELMEIFQGSPRFAPQGPDCCLSERHPMQPPSRQQNPVVKDQVRMRALIIAVCGRQAIAVADRSMCSRTDLVWFLCRGSPCVIFFCSGSRSPHRRASATSMRTS